MSRARETTLTLFVIYPCALHNLDTFRHILVIFGRNEEESRARDNSLFLRYVVITPEAEILYKQ